MKNADQPAFAQSFATDKDGNMYSAHEKDSRNAGLSKREYFAAMAMQGILAARYEANPVLHTPSPASAIQDAIRYADELLKQLES